MACGIDGLGLRVSLPRAEAKLSSARLHYGHGATNCSIAAARIQAALVERRALGVENVQARIQGSVDEGEVPARIDAGALASFYATVYQAMSMQDKDGTSKHSLPASVEMTMRSWPASPLSAERHGPARRATT